MSGADLIFSRPARTGPADLLFGENDALNITPVTLRLNGRIVGLRGRVLIRVAVVVRLAGKITGLRGKILLSCDSGVDQVAGCVESGWETAVSSAAQATTLMQRSVKRYGGIQGNWESGVPALAGVEQGYANALGAGSVVTCKFDDAVSVAGNIGARHQNADAVVRGNLIAFSQALESGKNWAALHANALSSGATSAAQWQAANPMHFSNTAVQGQALWLNDELLARFESAIFPAAGIRAAPVVVVPRRACYTPDPRLLFDAEWSSDANLVFICDRRAAVPAAVVVPIRRTYVTVNSIILRRVDGDIPIPAYGFAMSLDWQSWTWGWSTSIELSSLPLVTPGVDGLPVEVEAVINGVPYRLCVEGRGSQREFAKGRVGIKGRGLAAVLDEPYSPVLNYASLGARTAQQLMLDALTTNGVSIGWDVDWGLTDWPVPGNTWAHQGEYISAVKTIAAAAGGYVQPHKTAKTLRILPGYPAPPWAWDDVVPDFELPSAVVTVEGIDWLRKPGYNRVFVSGMNNGVLGQVTRAGTAGDSVAPMVTDALITHADAARQRGIAVLAGTGTQARVNISLPVLQETGLIMPGQFVRYTDADTGAVYMGLVRSTALNWSRPKMRQSLSIEARL